MLRSRALLCLLLVGCNSNAAGETSAGSTGSLGSVPGDSSSGATMGASEATSTTGAGPASLYEDPLARRLGG